MAMFFGIDSNYASNLFSSLNTGSNSGNSNGITGLLSEYSSIRSGSYKKLLNAYYSKSDDKSVNSKNSSISTSDDSTKKLKMMKDAADSVSDSVKELTTTGAGSAFSRKYVTKNDGTIEKEYDTDKIYKSVKSFVDDYNDLVDATEKSNTKSVASKMNSIILTTKSNSDMLGEFGIKINEDDTLSIDEEVFKKADMSDAKALFNGTGSYAYQIGVKASMISSSVSNEAAKSNTYTSNGTYSYNYSTGDLYNSLF